MGIINRLLCLGFTAFLAAINARRLPRGLPHWWRAKGEGELDVLVMFFRSDCWATNFHVACLIRDRGEDIYLDASSAQVRAIHRSNFPDSWYHLDPEFTVQTRAPRRIKDGYYYGGVFSCVELTKKVLKCNDFSIQTTSQLLRWLWEQKEG